MKYLVLYSSSHQEQVFVEGNSNPATDIRYAQDHFTTRAVSSLTMSVFEDEQEAAEYATKYNGYIVVPAQVKSVITSPGDLS